MDIYSAIAGLSLSAIGFYLIAFVEEDYHMDSIQKRNRENVKRIFGRK